MSRYLAAACFVVATLLVAAPASAAVLFSDGFEIEDGHTTLGAGTVGTNGWFITSPGLNNPSILPFSSGLDGQVANATAGGLTGGSGHADWQNDAGIAGGLTPGLEYTLSWTQKYNIGGSPNANGGLGFSNVNGIGSGGTSRASIAISAGTNFRIANPQDQDLDIPNIQPDETVVDFKIVLNENEASFYIDDLLIHTNPAENWLEDAFANASGIRTFVDDGGHYDNVLLTDSTPNLVNRWRNDTSGDWNRGSNWNTLSSPNSAEESAVFGSAIGATQTVFTNAAVTVNDMQFNNANSYIVSGGGTITLADGANVALPAPGITVSQGSHQIQAPIALNDAVTIDASSGQLDLNNGINTNGNALTLSGSVNVNHSITGGGTVSAMASAALGTAGSTALTGSDLTLAAGSTLSIDIAGTFANQFSAFEGINTATLGGADLEITLDGFTPAPGDTFEILDSVTLSGLLGNVANGATLSTSGGEGTFVVNYGAGSAFESNSVVLSGFTLSGGTLGDFDGDGDVDGDDFLAWQRTDGTSGGLSDWTSNYPTALAAAAGASSAVPEPSTALLVAFAMVLMSAPRRK